MILHIFVLVLALLAAAPAHAQVAWDHAQLADPDGEPIVIGSMHRIRSSVYGREQLTPAMTRLPPERLREAFGERMVPGGAEENRRTAELYGMCVLMRPGAEITAVNTEAADFGRPLRGSAVDAGP